jgi:hypothetical protein
VTAFTDPAPGGYRISFTKSPQVTIRNGEKGEDGENGEPGAAAPQIGVQEDGGVYYWTLGGEWLYKTGTTEKIPVTGPQGPSGPQGLPGATGVSPTLRINPTTNFWEVCLTGDCDEGSNEGWKSLDVKATGNDGVTPVVGAAEFPASSGSYCWTVDGEWLTDAGGNKIPLTGEQGQGGDPGADGVTPQLRISETSGEWEVCLTGSCDPDDWTSTGKIAAPQISAAEDTGKYYWKVNGEWLLDGRSKIPVTGDRGADGADGKTPKVAVGSDGSWYICPDGSCADAPPAAGWEDTHV